MNRLSDLNNLGDIAVLSLNTRFLDGSQNVLVHLGLMNSHQNRVKWNVYSKIEEMVKVILAEVARSRLNFSTGWGIKKPLETPPDWAPFCLNCFTKNIEFNELLKTEKRQKLSSSENNFIKVQFGKMRNIDFS